MTCAQCGKPLPAGSRRDRRFRHKNCRQQAYIARREAGTPPPPRWQHPALTSDNPVLHAAAIHAKHLGEAHGWSKSTTLFTLDSLVVLLENRPERQPIPLSEVRARTSRHASSHRVAEVLTHLELLTDDTTKPIRSWIEVRTGQLPAGFADDVRAWLLVLLDGDARTRPRSHSSIYVYFGSVRPPLEGWAPTRRYLREITTTDIQTALSPLRGWQYHNTASALRSLFRFAKKRGLIFANPTARLKLPAVARSLVPMTDAEIRAVEQTAITPLQRLAVALAAVHAARPASIRHLTLDDLDLPNRRITIAGHDQRLGELPPSRLDDLAPLSPRHLAEHSQPTCADPSAHLPGHRAGLPHPPPNTPGSLRNRPRTHPWRPGAPRGADHRARPTPPVPGLQPVPHHRQ